MEYFLALIPAESFSPWDDTRARDKWKRVMRIFAEIKGKCIAWVMAVSYSRTRASLQFMD